MRRAEPDRAALEIAHRQLRNKMPLDDMLRVAGLRATLYSLARRHMRRRDAFDP
jgi:hypothetical protein